MPNCPSFGIDCAAASAGSGKPPVPLGVHIDHRLRAPLAFGAKLGGISEIERPAPQLQRLLACLRSSSRKQGRRGAAHRVDCPVPGGRVRRPHQPRRLRKPRPDRHAARLRAVEPVKIRLAQHRIFGGEPVLLEIEDVGWNEAVGRRQPALAVRRAVIRNDQVEIEHPPVELALTQAGPVEQHRAARRPMLRCNRRRNRADPRIDGQAQFLGDERAQFGHVSRHCEASKATRQSSAAAGGDPSRSPGLLRCARNDGWLTPRASRTTAAAPAGD